jgi:membrane-associated protein
VGLDDVQAWIAAFSYPAMLALLVVAGFGAPLSEDVILVAGGLVAAAGNGSLLLISLTGWVGVVVGDSLLFRLGQKLGPRSMNVRFLQKLMTPQRVSRVSHHFARHGVLTIVLVRFCMGLRVPAYVTAGMSGMQYRRFLVADGLAALVYAPLLVWLGWRFGEAVLDDAAATLKWILFAALVVVGALYAAALIRRRRQRRSTPEVLRDSLTVGGLPPPRAKDAV